MAKDKVKVPSIKISNQKPGVAFGGVIYSADVSVGYNAEPTKLNVNVVLDTKLSKGRDFLISKKDLDLTSPVDIKIAEEPMFTNMFLNSYSINIGPSSKVLNLTYVDGSALLDRIFVGLIHEHFQVDKQKHSVPSVVSFDVKCPKLEYVPVSGTMMPVCSDDGTALYKDLKTYKHLASPTGIPGRPYQIYKQNKKIIWEGGYIILGREEFTEVDCDIRDVSYGFEDLLNCLRDKKFGWGINVDISRYTMTKDSNLLLRAYTGTVKDVLQSWGNDLKISYYWDFTKKDPTLAIISNADRSVDVKVDLAVAAIEKLDLGHYDKNGQPVESGKTTDFVINSKNQSVTLDGTLSQAYSSVFTVGPKSRTETTKKTSEAFFSCQTMDDIAASGNIMGRSSKDIKISLGLGKFSKDLRDIWNARRAISIAMDSRKVDKVPLGGLVKALPYFKAIGFHDIIPVTFWDGAMDSPGPSISGNKELGYDYERFREYVVGMCNLTQMFTNQAGKQDSADFLKDMNNPGGYEIFIGLYDDSLKGLNESIEGEIESGYIGKHYLLGAPKSESFEGSGSFKRSMRAETKPSSTYYSMNQHYKTPLAKFAKKISDLRLNSLVQSEDVYINRLYDESNKLKFDIIKECEEKNKKKSFYKDSMKNGFYHFERETHWATYQEDIDNLLNPNQLQLQSWLDNGGHLLYEESKERMQTSMLKEYLPFNAELPLILQFIEKMPSKMKAMMSAGEASDKKVVVCMVKTGTGDPKEQGVPMSKNGSTVIGDKKSGWIEVIPDFKENVHGREGRYVGNKGGVPNPIEEINALRSLCDRTTSAKADEQSKFQTVCERDFTQELCASKTFNQIDKSCGEAEALKDSLYSLELEPDIRLSSEDATRGKQSGNIYSDCIHLKRLNPKVPVRKKTVENEEGEEVVLITKSMPLFSDTRDPAEVVDRNKIDIIYPSENLHNGMIIYNTDETTTDLGIRKVFDPVNGSRVRINKAAASVQYQTKDITQDITSVINDSNQAQLLSGEVPTDIVADVDNIYYPYVDPVTKELVYGKDGLQPYAELQTLSALKYHERLRGNINDLQIEEPRKSYSFKIYVDGVEALKELIVLLNPENGLESLSINMDEGGFHISINMSNRASADVALRQIFNKTGPHAKEVGYKFSTLRST